MNLDTFKLFCDVARYNSFSRGAAMNGISQSAASQAIHHVERQIGAGVSILPEPTLRNEVRNHTLVAVPLGDNDLQRPLGIIHRRRKSFTPILTKFVEALTNIPEEPERRAAAD